MKLVLIKDLDGNELTISPREIIKVVESNNISTIETKNETILTKSDKLSIESSIHNCYLP
jgi:hypothetical protein